MNYIRMGTAEDYLDMNTSEALSATKSGRLQWRECVTRALNETEKYEAADGNVTYYLTVRKQSSSVPLPTEAYPLFVYSLESTTDGLIDREQGTVISEELKELFQLAGSPINKTTRTP
jgi:hypothetical protein